MDLKTLDIPGYFEKLKKKTNTNKLRWDVYYTDGKVITFVPANRDIKIVRKKTPNGVIIKLQNKTHGMYVHYLIFKPLEKAIINSHIKKFDTVYAPSVTMLNSLASIADKAPAKAEKKTFSNIRDISYYAKTQEVTPEMNARLENAIEIGLKDFVIRRNVFKCMHHHHKIKNVEAKISVIDKYGNHSWLLSTAGYCTECNIYFILEATYLSLKQKGLLMCRIADEKSYLKNNLINGMQLAQESILRQFGYTVSQEEGLSQTQRHKILAVLLDNDILTKSEIISYLDFFISQRTYTDKYHVAITKWQADLEFVENYRSGQYTQYGVSAIYRY